MNKNTVFIARSIDGFIADRNGGLGWLQEIPNPEQIDMGYQQFMENIDAIVMGRVSFEQVCSFDCDWPYSQPVFVLSRTLKTVPEEYQGKVQLINGSLKNVLKTINQKGFSRLYIDGGSTVQGFLQEDLIDELILTTIPILLGGGTSLFSDLPKEMKLEHVNTEVFLNQVVQSHYRRKS